jgi:hypothetical protein
MEECGRSTGSEMRKDRRRKESEEKRGKGGRQGKGEKRTMWSEKLKASVNNTALFLNTAHSLVTSAEMASI